jgi:peroxiredoxin
VVQLGELQDYYAAFQKAGVGVYAVSMDAPEDNARLKTRLGAGYEFLSDAKGELLDALDIHQRHWPGLAVVGVRPETAVPTQYLLDRAGIVRWLYRAETWRVRAKPTEALRAIQLIKPCEALHPIGNAE